MQSLVVSCWSAGQRWTPGELAWAYVGDGAGADAGALTLHESGFAWRVDGVTTVVAASSAQAVSLADGAEVELRDTDLELTAAFAAVGYAPVLDGPFLLDLRQPAGPSPAVSLAAGYGVRAARPGDDLVGVHRAAWRPADLPFAPGFALAVATDDASQFTDAELAAVTATWPYDPAGHLVAVDPGGAVVGSALVWPGGGTTVAEIEPLGVAPAHRRRGVASALAAAAVGVAASFGDRTIRVLGRGDAAYPGPRGAYHAAGFAAVAEIRRWRRSPH